MVEGVARHYKCDLINEGRLGPSEFRHLTFVRDSVGVTAHHLFDYNDEILL